MSWRDTLDEWEKETKQPTSQPKTTSSWRQAVEELNVPEKPGILSKAGTFAAGIGRGVTAGLTRYPAAGVLLATRGGEGGFKEALADVRRYEQQASEQAPIASAGGEILGGVLGAGKLISLAGKVAPAVVAMPAAGALYSGTTEFTRAPETGLGDVAGSAAIGAAGAAIPGVATKAAQTARDTVVKNKYIANQIGYAEKFNKQGIEAAQKVEPTLLKAGEKLGYKMEDLLSPSARSAEASLEVLKAIRANKVPGMKIPQADRDLAKTAVVSLAARNRRLDKIEEVKDLTGDALRYKVKGSMTGSAGKETKEAVQFTRDVLPSMGMGALIGAGGFGLMGQDPMLGASLGGGSLGLAAKMRLGSALQHQGIKLASTIPTVSPSFVGGLGAAGGTQLAPTIMRPQQPQMGAPIELPPLQQPTQPEVTDLDRLLERVRQTYGSQ
jgi:hypothetical protein